MNSLSWMIYTASVVGDLKVLIASIGILGIFGLLIASLHYGIEADLGNVAEGTYKAVLKKLWIPIVFIAIAIFIPGQSTVYMVAASEAGEQVINTPEAREMFDVLRQRIMEELKVEAK